MKSKTTEKWNREYLYGNLGEEAFPDFGLMRCCPLVPKGRVLDLGGGNGRNAILFAEKGYDVSLVDCSQAAIEKCKEEASLRSISLKFEKTWIQDFVIGTGDYSLIIAALVLQAFKKEEYEKIISSMILGVQPGGYLYVSVLSTADSGYHVRSKTLPETEKRTFFLADRNIHVHYFTTEELLSYFCDWKIIYCAETRHIRREPAGKEFPYQASIDLLVSKI